MQLDRVYSVTLRQPLWSDGVETLIHFACSEQNPVQKDLLHWKCMSEAATNLVKATF